MRVSLNQLEELPPTAFVLLVGIIGGVQEGFHDLAAPRSVLTAVAAQLSLAAAALVLWWVSVRRRRFSVWRTACHLTLALGLAQVLRSAFVLTHVFPDAHLDWPDAAEGFFITQLALSPARFAMAAVLVAAGRLLPGSGRPIDHHAYRRPDREPVS